jgi:hypothetical protein
MEFLDKFKEFNDSINRMSLLGSKINNGTSRTVYEFPMDENLVVKVEQKGMFANVKEYDFWSQIKHTKLEKFYAECVWLSDDGKVLIQERTTPITEDLMPKKVPEFMTDCSCDNFGKTVDGRIVCIDYSMNYMVEILAKQSILINMKDTDLHNYYGIETV